MEAALACPERAIAAEDGKTKRPRFPGEIKRQTFEVLEFVEGGVAPKASQQRGKTEAARPAQLDLAERSRTIPQINVVTATMVKLMA
jgi:hypothetical protein